MSERRHYDRETLRDVLATRYLAGGCTGFAVAVHRRTGWPLVVIRAGDGGLSHTGCKAPDGRLVDARGFLDEEEFFHPFPAVGGIHPVTEEQALREHPQSEGLISTAGLHADMLLDLPGYCPERRKFDEFAVALADFCRERGMWLRGPNAGVLESFIAYEAYGEEEGFEVEIMPLGGALLTRKLGPDRDT